MRLSSKLRSANGGHVHWCPGCLEMHVIPNTWKFNGNVESPTFVPSIKLLDKKEATFSTCHYNITNGRIYFHGDCIHELRGKDYPLPDIPTDEKLGLSGYE